MADSIFCVSLPELDLFLSCATLVSPSGFTSEGRVGGASVGVAT